MLLSWWGEEQGPGPQSLVREMKLQEWELEEQQGEGGELALVPDDEPLSTWRYPFSASSLLLCRRNKLLFRSSPYRSTLKDWPPYYINYLPSSRSVSRALGCRIPFYTLLSCTLQPINPFLAPLPFSSFVLLAVCLSPLFLAISLSVLIGATYPSALLPCQDRFQWLMKPDD